MRNRMIKLSLAIFILMLPTILLGQIDNKSPFIGYQDADHDGFNDLFRDANGDGVNDITSQPYFHHFKFEDQNKDGLNDLWIDRDGDGVNDLMFDLLRKRNVRAETPWIDSDGDGIQEILNLSAHVLHINYLPTRNISLSFHF